MCMGRGWSCGILHFEGWFEGERCGKFYCEVMMEELSGEWIIIDDKGGKM